MYLTFQNFVAHLHPALVHLPVGIFFLICMYQWFYSGATQYEKILRPALWIGTIAALFSCISGFLLSLTDDYDPALEEQHLISGISLFIFSAGLLVLNISKGRTRYDRLLYSVLFVLLIITGHLGGSLTHGEGYLTEAFYSDENELKDAAVRKKIENIDSAVVYADIIQPLLEEKCYSCHGRNKRKGGLRMDREETLMKGGKEGVVIIPGNPAKSEMVRRIELPRNHDDHMPPKEKSQLTEQELKMIHWWVATGAAFDKKTYELPQTPEIRTVLLESFQTGQEKETLPLFPLEPVEAADNDVIASLKKIGVVITNIGVNNNYLYVNLMNGRLNSKDGRLLSSLKKQLVWLKASNEFVDDSLLVHIGNCKNLRKLQLNDSRITDNGIKQLNDLTELQHLNVVGTHISVKGLLQLNDLKKLVTVYCYQSQVKPEDLPALKRLFPKTEFNFGGYIVPTLPGDTSVLEEY